MDTIIQSSEINPDGTSHVYASAGKISAYVGQYKGRHVTVSCLNASNRAWRGMGRTFHGKDAFDQALAAYKSAEMKAIIAAAREHIAPRPENVILFPLSA
jgi:hypothetical protein